MKDSEIEIIRDNAKQAFEALRAQAKVNGVSDMTLEEINEEISRARYDEQQMSDDELQSKEFIYTYLAKSADDVEFGRVENADDVFTQLKDELKH